MAEHDDIAKLFDLLQEDEFRKTHQFGAELAVAHSAIVHPYARDGDRTKAMELWLKKAGNQPCLFGRIAVAVHRMHFCFLTDRDLLAGDQHVTQRIQTALVSWKRRSLRPSKGLSTPAHGFMLVVASERVALAAPDQNLFRFACRIRDLWGCASTDPQHGTVYWETLYLQNPADRTYIKFAFSVDFFAAQGDGRWWQDHRVPGGIAFTANSAGHMRRFREWYENKGDQRNWLLKTAMLTIDSAAETPYGRATWLRPLADGRPIVERVQCPFASAQEAGPKLQGKDWTRYGGNLHTDHSIRPEFFDSRPDKPLDVQNKNWLQDFVYLYDQTTQDHVRFSAGQNISQEEVFDAIGDPEEFTDFEGPIAATEAQTDQAAPHPEVAALLAECEKWDLSDQEIADLNK